MLRDGAVTWCVATNGQGRISFELSQFKSCFSSSWLSVMVISSLRVAEEREREIEREIGFSRCFSKLWRSNMSLWWFVQFLR